MSGLLNCAKSGWLAIFLAGLTMLMPGVAHAAPPQPPTVTTDAATPLSTGATLNGTVNPNNKNVTSVTFNYGLTAAYGSSINATPFTIASGSGNTAVSAALAGLTCGSTYHFRVVATNSAGTTSGADATFTACTPSVVSINTASTNPSPPNTSVSWTVTFDQNVTGVDVSDFMLVQTGGVTGASITSVANSTGGTGADTSWTVTANTGTGSGGTLGLNLLDDDTIINATSTPLGGTGAGNGNFTGQVYSISLMDHVLVDAPTTAMALVDVPVTLAPHSAAHGSISAAGTISLSTSTGLGDWTIGAGTGTLTPGAANSGQATYTFGAGESSVTLTFVYQAAGTVVLKVADNSSGTNLLSNTPVAELANTIVFSMPTFVFTDSICADGIAFGAVGQTCVLYSWSPQVAGVNAANVYITAVNGSGIPTRLSNGVATTRNLDFALSCHDPASNAGMQATFAGVTLPLCQANGAKPTTWSATIAAVFPKKVPSVGPYTFNYPDVGQVELWMQNSASTAQVGSSNPLVVAPDHFVISGVTAAPIKAGNNFAATVTAYNGLATPTATANFGKETAPEGATLTFSKCQPTGTNSSNGVFSGSTGAFTGGAATASNLNWDEVGNGDLVATLSSGSYLSSGKSATGNTGTGGAACTGAGNVGPFIPDHFDTTVTGPMTCPGGLTCPAGGLVYSGQSFTADVYARNATGGTTQNYDGTANTSPNFAKTVTLGAWDALGSTTTNNPPAASPGALSGSSGTFSKGTTVSPGTPGAPVYTFGTTPTAPTDIYLRADDSDGVSSLRAVPATSVEGGVKVVSGRISLSNAFGSELLMLTIPATAQYWDGTRYLTSATDNSTQFDTHLDTAGGNVHASIVKGPLAAVGIGTPGTVTFANGITSFKLAVPGAAGSADLTIVTAPSYLLPGTTGHATFGVYKRNNNFIYMRENY